MPSLQELIEASGVWDRSDWNMIGSIVPGESSHNAAKVNTTMSCGKRADGSAARAVGLMQICTLHLDPGGLAEGLSESDLKNPITNLRVAKKIKDAQGWDAWEVVTSGKLAPAGPSLKRSVVGAGTSTGPDSLLDQVRQAEGGGISDIDLPDLNPVDNITDWANQTFTNENLFKAGKVALGGAFIILGVAGLVFVVAKNVSSATPIGQIRKMIK